MALQLNPSKFPIWKSETALKLGVSDQDQVLEEVTNAQERLINLLFQGVAEDQIELFGSSVGLTDSETNDLVSRLRPSLLNSTTSSADAVALSVRFAEIIRIGFESNDAPETILVNRNRTLIAIRDLNRTGLLIIKALSESGFSDFETKDYEFVSRQDLGELGFQTDHLGISRLEAARGILKQNRSTISIAHPASKKPKNPRVEVLCATHRILPTNYRTVDSPHIAIEYGLEQLRVTPIILPGTSPCLGCRDLWESEQDTNWTATAIQLTARNDSLDDGSALLLATAIASKSICQFVDGRRLETGFAVSLKTRTVSEYSWPRHPSCQCLTKR